MMKVFFKCLTSTRISIIVQLYVCLCQHYLIHFILVGRIVRGTNSPGRTVRGTNSPRDEQSEGRGTNSPGRKVRGTNSPRDDQCEGRTVRGIRGTNSPRKE